MKTKDSWKLHHYMLFAVMLLFNTIMLIWALKENNAQNAAISSLSIGVFWMIGVNKRQFEEVDSLFDRLLEVCDKWQKTCEIQKKNFEEKLKCQN